jgi:hypothetical protein
VAVGQVAPAAASCQTPLPVQSVSGVGAPPLGGDQDFGIQFTLAGCNWNITTNTPWLSITGPTSGTTAANIVQTKYHAQANPGNTTRHGSLIISVPPNASTTVDIAQDGSGCVLAISPSIVHVIASGGTGTFTVTATPSTCVLGVTTNPPADGAPAPSTPPLATTVVTPTVSIGGIAAAHVVYAGLSPGQVGLYQIDVEIPAEAPSGSAIPVQVAVGSQVSNTATIAIQ